jgi:hypothetical protein
MSSRANSDSIAVRRGSLGKNYTPDKLYKDIARLVRPSNQGRSEEVVSQEETEIAKQLFEECY